MTNYKNLTKKTLTASFDASSKSPSWLNKQISTRTFSVETNVSQNTTIKSVTGVWKSGEELRKDGNIHNSQMGNSTSYVKSISIPGNASPQIYSGGDYVFPPAKFPRLPGGHEEYDKGKSRIYKNGEEKSKMNNFDNANKTNHPSHAFNHCSNNSSCTKTDAVTMRDGNNLCGQVIDNHGYTAELSSSGTTLCSPIPSCTITTKELITPLPENPLGKNVMGNAIIPCKIVSPSLKFQSTPHQKMSSTALRTCPNSTLLQQRALTPTLTDGGLRRPITSTSELQPLLCSIESPSVTVGAQYSPSANSSCVGTPVTNHLIQLVSAANRTPEILKLDRPRAKRRFPGPAGILPQQHHGKNLDEVLISAPQTPAHGAVPKLHPQEHLSSQQSVEDDFGKGPWATMKEELQLDERDTSCFLRNYSIAMVLRKAALKQLPKGKVPNMAVLVKSLTRTNTDASAVFKDPSGEMQGTIHRQFLIEQPNDLKVGTVLLLKQVGVFSPSLRNHYLNITPSNVIKIYPQGANECIRNQLAQSSQNHIGLLQQSMIESLQSSCSSLTTDKVCIATTRWDFEMPPSSTKKEALKVSGSKSAALEGQCDEEWEPDDLDDLVAELPEELFTAL
ncbi:homologous recombination OB-fold protein [Narcine bancroftii]|uniref:homologous recombination OB-fold protein n=1 Tax=Narcine bancroftii TaxID=1343680 RepID=UPI003831A35C